MTNVLRLQRRRETVELDDKAVVVTLITQEIHMAERVGTTYAQISAATKISTQTISRLSYGETKSPHYNTVVKLLMFFGYRVYAQR